MARITVLMPVYNGEKYLNETIESVLNQTFSDFIFLIINDGSIDKSENIILSYKDPRIAYYKNEKNLGLVSTLNYGIELVDTEFLARMDADDIWIDTKLEKQLNLLDSRLDVGICGTSTQKFGAYNSDFIFPVNNEELKVGFLFYCCMSHPSVIFRMSFLKETGIRYNPDYFPAEDYKMWVECLDYTQIVNLTEKLVLYRQHEDQITSDSNNIQKLQSNRVQKELLKKINIDDSYLDFYINVFLKRNSNNEIKKTKLWIKSILENNKANNYYFNDHLLKNSLYKFHYVNIQNNFLNVSQKKHIFLSLYNYFISLNWLYVPIIYSIKLFIKLLKNEFSKL